jgi:secreted trypsin-like serine protease
MSACYRSIVVLCFLLCNRLVNGRMGETTRIVGGTEVEQGVYPYFGKSHIQHADVQICQCLTQHFGGLSVFWSTCGASLIHGDIALTAAHVSLA